MRRMRSGCCARAASGHAAAAPPSNAMKFAPPHVRPQAQERGIVAPQTSALIGSNQLSLLQHGRADVRFGSKADMAPQSGDVRYAPESGHQAVAAGCPLSANSAGCTAANAPIRSPRRRGRAADRRHGEAERLGGLEVDHQFVLGRRLHRQVGRLLALEDAVDVAGRPPVLVDQIRPIGDQAAAGDEEADGVDRGQLCRAASAMIRLAMKRRRRDSPSRSGRHSGSAAKSVMARSISPASRTSTGLNSTPNDGATDWMAAELADPGGCRGIPKNATRVTRGAISFSSSSHFALIAVFELRRTRWRCRPAAPGSRRSRRQPDRRRERTRSARCGLPAATPPRSGSPWPG